MTHAEAIAAAADLNELAAALNAAEADFLALHRSGLNGVPMDEYYYIDLTNLPRWGTPPKGMEGLFSWDEKGRVLERAGNRWRVVMSVE
ncbi:hypothetical protein [Ruegeria sp.]|uniref:hypothetical protein n=1 Tax=Ruegeria sp. TaxID=1879320 RepID=UPI003AFF664B